MGPNPFKIVPSPATARTDGELAQALQRGERAAELEAWNRFAPGTVQTLRRLMGPGLDREDLLQEVYLRFFQNIRTLREPAAVRGFLAGICVHVVRQEIARRQRARWLRLTATGSAPDIGTVHPDPENRDVIARYYRILDQLSGQERSIFVSRTIEKLTLAEVAELHGVSVSTAQRRLARATKRVAALVRRDPVLSGLAGGSP
ncbi:MAG TPA: sigma-70 family RNA polymerase sigma factor [Polyangia bacterium]|nr:sigma-70 family RNA polymerase sigma factor [Polyangia bacterium]